MNLIEAARQLASDSPLVFVGDSTWRCAFCLVSTSGEPDQHLDDCPWLAMPQIVAALEAAERVADKLEGPFKAPGSERYYGLYKPEALDALRAALEG